MSACRVTLIRGVNGLTWAAEQSCLLAVLVMTGLTLIQVVLRYIFRSPLVWTEEASVFLMIWMTFVGAGVAMRRGAHIAMTLLVERFPPGLSRGFIALARLLMLAFLAVVAWQGWLLAMSVGGQRSPALAVPMTWPYLTMPLGAAFMGLQLIAVMLESSASEASGDLEVI
jgi:TRAP-type C4-dicarboxylate transport system permease small subunit